MFFILLLLFYLVFFHINYLPLNDIVLGTLASLNCAKLFHDVCFKFFNASYVEGENIFYLLIIDWILFQVKIYLIWFTMMFGAQKDYCQSLVFDTTSFFFYDYFHVSWAYLLKD